MSRSTWLAAFLSIVSIGMGASQAEAQTLGEEFGEVMREYGNIVDEDMVIDSSASSSGSSYVPRLHAGYEYVRPSNGLFNSVANYGSNYKIGVYIPLTQEGGGDSGPFPFPRPFQPAPGPGGGGGFGDGDSSWPCCGDWEIGLLASYNYTDFDMKNDVDFNVLGGNNYQLQTMRQNIFRGGMRFGRAIPLGGESSRNDLIFDVTPTMHIGRIHGNFDVSPFVAGNKQIFADQDPNRNDKELIFGGGVKVGVGMRTAAGLIRFTYGVDRSNTRFGTGSRRYNTLMNYGLEVDFDFEELVSIF